MNRNRIRKLVSLVLVVMVGMLVHLPGAAAAPLEQAGDGFRTLSGAEAASFIPPGDMQLVRDLALGNGLRYERYQQFFGDAAVLGGQITTYRDGSGTISMVIGAHYTTIVPANSIRRSPDDAAAAAQRDVGVGESRAVELLIDPATGLYFYRVETRGFDTRWIDITDYNLRAVPRKAKRGSATNPGTAACNERNLPGKIE